MDRLARISTQSWVIFVIGVVVAVIAAVTRDDATTDASTSAVAMVSAVVLLGVAGFLMMRDLRGR